jgi:TonB family protein
MAWSLKWACIILLVVAAGGLTRMGAAKRLGAVEGAFGDTYRISVSVKFVAKDRAAPKEKRIAMPEYPPKMHYAGMGGDVDFSLTVQENGKVTDILVTGKNTPQEFLDSAKQAIAAWEFVPSTADSRYDPRPCGLKGKFEFRMYDE